jgi:hypothetical protein
MAKYIIVQDGGLPVPELTEAKNLKAAVEGYPNPTNENLVAWRVVAGPTKVRIRQETVTVYDIGVEGGSWDNEEE